MISPLLHPIYGSLDANEKGRPREDPSLREGGGGEKGNDHGKRKTANPKVRKENDEDPLGLKCNRDGKYPHARGAKWHRNG